MLLPVSEKTRPPMSDKTTNRIEDALEHAPVEDYGGDDQQSAHGTVMQPSDAEYTAVHKQATDADNTATATDPPADSSRDG